jgi:hypothetical protein
MPAGATGKDKERLSPAGTGRTAGNLNDPAGKRNDLSLA